MDASLATTLPTPRDLHRVRGRIAGSLRDTPVLRLDAPTPDGPRPVALKLELLQVTGCFKVRGALAAVSPAEGNTVVACSGGNHGLGVAHAARELGKRAVLFVPTDAASAKVEAMRSRGAEVRQPHEDMAATFRAAAEHAAVHGLPFIHPYDDPAVVAGQGTLGLELLEQAPEVEHWVVAVGGGGLAAGLCLALEGRAEVVPVEPAACPALAEAQARGCPVSVAVSGSARTSLGAPSVGRLPWEILQNRVGPVALVSEDEIRWAQAWLWREARLVAEPGGAAALAALLSGAWRPPKAGPVGVVLCGGNADALPAGRL